MRFFKYKAKQTFDGETKITVVGISWTGWAMAAGGFLLFLIIIFNSGIMIVDTGHRGVKIKFGEVVSKSIPEGIQFYNPITSDIIEMDTRVQKEEGETLVYTKDIQNATIKYVVNYNLSQTEAHLVYRDIGFDYVQKIVRPAIIGTVKDVIGKWEASELIENREQAAAQVLETLGIKLAPQHVNAVRFEIMDIEYSKEFEAAIESKVTAIQKATEAENHTRRIAEEAKQRVITAEAEAKKLRIQAQAIARSPQIVELERVKVQAEAVEKWNGTLPVYMMGESGAVPFIGIK